MRGGEVTCFKGMAWYVLESGVGPGGVRPPAGATLFPSILEQSFTNTSLLKLSEEHLK